MSITIDLSKNQRILLSYWLTLTILILIADFFSGPYIQFPILYLIPIALASWYNGRRWGQIFAVSMPLVRLYYSINWVGPWTMSDAVINTLIRMVVFAGFAYLIDRVVSQKRELEKEIRILEGILPICSFCKNIRDEAGSWKTLEGYITEHSEAEFTHGFCPECAKKHYPEFFKN